MKWRWHISAFTCLALACGCDDPTPVAEDPSQMGSALHENDAAASGGSAKSLLDRRLFQQSAPFRVLSITRGNDAYSSSRDTSECKGWSLTEKECADVLAGLSPVTGPEWHHLFDVLSCQVKGELSQDGSLFEFVINAGSWFSVACGDTALLFGDTDMKYTGLFISSVWVEEEDR